MHVSVASNRLSPSCAVAVVAAILACALFALPSSAYAEVRLSDEVLGSTVDDLDLSVAECPSIYAERAILVTSDGTVLYGRNANDSAQIASITKVMTAIVAIENAPMDTKVAVSAAAANIGESSANLQEGDVLDLESALKALLVPSGNDAAVAIAETVGAIMIANDPSLGNDPVTVFVDAMNKKAVEIGCNDTLYENPHGLDDEEFAGKLHSTASDQAKVAQCAMGYELIRDIVSGGSTTISVLRDGAKETVELETTDELLESYQYCIGVKTGVTDSAGPSFMGAANKDGFEVYTIVLDSADEYTRFSDTKNMCEWAFEHVLEIKLANTSETCIMTVDGKEREVPVVAEVAHLDWTDKTVKATLADPDASITVFDLQGNISQTVEFEELHGTVVQGQRIGTVVYRQRNKVVAEQSLIACERVDAPDPFTSIGVWWARTVGGVTGDKATAKSRVYNVMPIINNNISAAA